MRALIAEENFISRAYLRTILERNGFSVDEVYDELGAASLLTQPCTCDLVILSIRTVLVDFAAICSTIRRTNSATYVVALLPSDWEHEAQTALDAGADDFLVDDSHLKGIEARIRVIRRFLQRHGRPLDLIAMDGAPRRRAARQVPDAGGPVFRYANVPLALETVFRDLRLPPLRRKAPTQFTNVAYSGWLPIMVKWADTAQWINTRIDLDDDCVALLYRALAGSASRAEEDLRTRLLQFLTLVQDDLQRLVSADSPHEIYFPVAPFVGRWQEMRGAIFPVGIETEQVCMGASDRVQLRVTAAIEPSPLIYRSIDQLHRHDVLGAALEGGHERTLLREGIMLDDLYISKIKTYAASREMPSRVPVFRPPGETILFLSRILR